MSRGGVLGPERTYFYSDSLGVPGRMDTALLFQIGAIAAPFVALAVAYGVIRRRFAHAREEATRFIVDFLFVDQTKDGKPLLTKDGRHVKGPNPEILAWAASYADAALPLIVPKAIEYGKKHIKAGDVLEVAGGGGLIDEKALRPLVGKKYSGLAAAFLPAILQRFGFGTPRSPTAIDTTGRSLGSAPSTLPPGGGHKR